MRRTSKKYTVAFEAGVDGAGVFAGETADGQVTTTTTVLYDVVGIQLAASIPAHSPIESAHLTFTAAAEVLPGCGRRRRCRPTRRAIRAVRLLRQRRRYDREAEGGWIWRMHSVRYPYGCYVRWRAHYDMQ